MKESGRTRIEDQIIDTDLNSVNYHNHHFIRIGSKEHTFKKVNFSHTYFENCYFRNVVFDSCDFNGCKFINCNFQGSTFPGSKFEYAIFEKTFIDDEILNKNCPSWNNLTLKFARTLRINYQSIGEAEAVNKAIKIELKATKEHLYDAWNSRSAYYRKKYDNWSRVKYFFKWLNFKIQDFIWGNGENPIKLFITGCLFWIVIALSDTIFFSGPNLFSSILKVPAIFMGIDKPTEYPNLYMSFITIIRFIGFALFTSILIKRYNKR